MSRTEFFLVLFALHCPSSLLIPLAQDVASTSNTDNLVVLEPNQNEQITPNHTNVAEIIQQIDVKDNENEVISNINHVVITDDNIQNDNNGTQNNLIVNGEHTEHTGNVSPVLNTTGLTNPNSSSSLLLTNSLNGASGNTLKDDNIPIHGLQKKLSNEAQTNPLNSTNNANENKVAVKEVRTAQNSKTPNLNVSGTLVPYISGRSTKSIGGENIGVPTVETVEGDNVLLESFNDAEVELVWRSDIPVEKIKTKKLKHIAKLDSQNATLLANNINGKLNNNNSDLLNSKNDEDKSIFVILNSGNIDGLSVNSPANIRTNLENNAIENLNSSNSKLLNDLINSTINDVLSKILQQNHSNFNSSHIFLLLNSGSISNVHVSSPVFENVIKNTTLKDRSRRHLNESDANNTNVESVTLKSSSDTTSQIIDVKFRTGEHRGTQNNVNKDNDTASIPLDNKQNNTSLGSNDPDNDTPANSNATAEESPIEDISSAVAPAFRSLLPDKVRKFEQISNVVNNVINETEDHNVLLKLTPGSPPLTIDLNQIPLNNLLGGALSIIRRLKRNTHDKKENSYRGKTNCKSKQIGKHRTVTSCKKSKLNDNDLTIPTRKSFDDDISNVLKVYDSVELVCPLAVIVKLYTHQVLDNIAKNDPDGVLNKILSSFLKGNKDAIDLVTKEILDLPMPVKVRLQLVHGKTKEFMEQLSDIVDATLCSLS